MPLTVERIVEETRTWTDDQLVILIHRLSDRLHEIDPQIEAHRVRTLDPQAFEQAARSVLGRHAELMQELGQ